MKRRASLFLSIFFTGCALEIPDTDKLPVWSATLEVPIIETTIDLSEFLEDSLISSYPIGEGGDSIFVFNKTIELDSVEVGDKLKIDPIEKSFLQFASAVTVDSLTTSFTIGYDSVGLDDITELIDAEIGLIELDNIGAEETGPISFADVMPTTLVTAIETAIAATGGTAEVVVDTVALVPQQKSISFDSFTFVVLSSGYLDVTITNNLFIPLGAPIYVDIKNSIGAQIFQLTWDTEIAAGDSATATQDVSGMTLPGNMLVEISGTSNGSQGQQVAVTTADLSSTFSVGLAVREFQVTQASAVVPAQSIADTSSIALDPSETVVDEAIMSRGNLDITITNNLGTPPLIGTVYLTIPSLYFGSMDSTFKLNFDLATGRFTMPTVNMAGWTMAMDFVDQYLDYHYLITTANTDPNSVTISQTDYVELDLGITDIYFSAVTGQIESQIIIEGGDINIESESQIQSATISDGQMDLVISNTIGGAADVQLTVPELVRDGTSLDTVLTIIPGDNEYIIVLAGYDLQPVSLADQRLTYSTITITQSESNTYYLNDSIAVAIILPGLTFNAVTGYISQDNNMESDVIELDNDTKVETALIDSGQIQLTIRNFIGLEADVLFSIDELTVGGYPLETSLQIISSTDPVQQTIDLAGYSLTLPVDDQRVNYTSTLSIPTDQLLSLTLNDSIAIDVFIDTLWFGSITGIIDTVDVTIDTVEQEISSLPDDMDGFEFANVEMAIDFESSINIPVFLDLTMEASNSGGEMETSFITNWNITDSSQVIIPNASTLINIQPDKILAYGSARVGGDGTSGTITSADVIAGLLSLRAPLELEIGPDATITTDPGLVTKAGAAETVPEEIEDVVVFISYDNSFEFGSTLTVLMSRDTLDFESGAADILVDALLITAGAAGVDSINLNDNRLGLFNQDSMYVQVQVKILGQTDSNGNPIPSRFLSTDKMQLNIYGRVQYFIDGPELAGDG
jgi:hypothetical protein